MLRSGMAFSASDTRSQITLGVEKMEQMVVWENWKIERLREFCQKWQITFDEFIETLDHERTERFFRLMEGNVDPLRTMDLKLN